MQVVGAVAAQPRLGSAELGRWITELHHGLFRSAVTGQANAILVSRRFTVSEERTLMVSTYGERRVAQGLRLERVVHIPPHLELQPFLDGKLFGKRELCPVDSGARERVPAQSSSVESRRICERIEVEVPVLRRRGEAVRTQGPILRDGLAVRDQLYSAPIAREIVQGTPIETDGYR